MPSLSAKGMEFAKAAPITWTDVIAPHVIAFAGKLTPGTRVLDIGCGTGYWASYFAGQGCDVVGIDPSESGIRLARAAHPGVRFEQMEASESLLVELAEAPFDLAISTEVVEHLYDPPNWAAGAFLALRPGGRFVISTPYHGWLKNLALAVSAKTDVHHDSLRVGGHIKFFSRSTIITVLSDAGFRNLEFAGAGRVPYLWRSMVLAAKRPVE